MDEPTQLIECEDSLIYKGSLLDWAHVAEFFMYSHYHSYAALAILYVQDVTAYIYPIVINLISCYIGEQNIRI